MSVYGDILRNLRESRTELDLDTAPDTVAGFVMEFYAGKTRKGLHKSSQMHPLNVVEHLHMEDVDDPVLSAQMFRVALLHDVLEDSGMSLEVARDKFNLDEAEMQALKVLSRNHSGEAYIEGIMADPIALPVKLADRVSNIGDLILWVEERGGFTEESHRIAQKYLAEDPQLLEAYTGNPDEVDEDAENTHIMGAWQELQELHKRLVELMEEHAGVPLKEAVFKNAEEFEITRDDIMKTMTIVKDLYHQHETLQKAYPDMLRRLEKVMNQMDQLIARKGFDHLRRLFDRVRFNEEDFLRAYQSYVEDKLWEGLKGLQTRKQRVPKSGLLSDLAKEMRIPVGTLNTMISSTDVEEVKKVYIALTNMMNRSFKEINTDLKNRAKRYRGYNKSRPGRFKDPGRAADKFVEKLQKGEYQDFLDLTDIMGFRGVFKDVYAAIDYANEIVKTRDNHVFKIESYLGKGSPYQGVNLNINYQGSFNYEAQSVIDKIQIGTDLNHDIIYKEIIKVSQEEKEAVMMLVQIGMGMIFEEMFDF